MATDSMALLERLGKAAEDGDVDFLRQGVKALAQVLMEAEVSTLIGAEHGERAPERRTTHRNGYRERRLVGMLLAEQDDEWAVGRAYFSAESMAQIDGPRPSPEALPELLMAS